MYNNQNEVSCAPPDERLLKNVAEAMNVYCNLPTEDQVPFFKLFKDHVLRHRQGMINDCRSDLEATEHRHKSLVQGLEEIAFDNDRVNQLKSVKNESN